MDGLDNIVAKGARLETLANGFRFIEGPLYDARADVLLFSDIPADTIYAYALAAKKTDVFRLPSQGANGNTFDAQHRLLSCEHKARRVSRTGADGRIVTLADTFENKRLNSPNDVVVKSDGAIYFTDPPYGLPQQSEGKELDFSGVFCLRQGGALSLLARDMPRPNGLAFSPDETKLYVSDSQERHLRVFDVLRGGDLGGGRVLADLRGAADARGVPDGLKVDAKGTIFCTGAGGVWVFGPSGTHLGTIPTPHVVANVAFGGKDGKTLFLTASTTLSQLRLQNPGPVPGR